MTKSQLLTIVFCALGFWLVWEFRILGLFLYAAILFSSRFFGNKPTGVLSKAKERKALYIMYGSIYSFFLLTSLAGLMGDLRPISIKLASSGMIPSPFDNAVLLVDSSKDQLHSLLIDADPDKKRRILSDLNKAERSSRSSPIKYYISNIKSFAASIIFVFFSAIYATKSRMHYVDAQLVADMTDRNTLGITYELKSLRQIYGWSGVFLLTLCFQHFGVSRIEIEDVGRFIASGTKSSSEIVSNNVHIQSFMLWFLWHFMRYPFRATSET